MDPVNLLKIVLEVCVVVVFFIAVEAIKFSLKPFHTGFYCDDYSISLPYKPSTVSNVNLAIISLVFPLVFLVVTEFVRIAYFHSDKMSSKISSTNTKLRYVYKLRMGKKIFNVNEEFGNLYINCGTFLFGLVATVVLTDLGKMVVGRLRPNFLSVCEPDVNPYKTLCKPGVKYYIQPEIDFKCMSNDKDRIMDSRLSFPSGHSSLSFYSMVFLILFIKHSWNCRSFGIAPRLVQLILLIVAIFTALSRVIDNKHHPTDVLAGTLLGTFVAICMFHYLMEFLSKRNYKVKYETSNDYEMSAIDDERCSLFIGDGTGGGTNSGLVNKASSFNRNGVVSSPSASSSSSGNMSTLANKNKLDLSGSSSNKRQLNYQNCALINDNQII